MKNREVVDTFNHVADMLAIRGDQVHRVLAYRRGAESIDTLGRDVNQVYEEGTLTDIPGIGETLAAKIEEMLTTGRLEFYERLAQEIPPSLVGMLRVEGLGPKRVKQIYDVLGVTTLDELTVAAQEGRLRELPGMGTKSEAKIVAALEALAAHGDDRVLLGDALPVAEALLAELAALPGVVKASLGGSLRRRRETIGDIDLLLAAAEAEPIMEHFCQMAQVDSVVVRGPTKSRVLLHNGMGVDLRVLPPDRWGTLLSYFTGSKEHNVRLRERALKRGLSLNEHAFTVVSEDSEILCEDEATVYATLDLPYIPPTLREDRGEIEAAQKGRLPKLVTLSDLISDLHMHTVWSDGKLTISELATAAREDGLQVMAVTDHSVSLGIANGLSAERLREQAAEIRAVAAELGPDLHILHGTEMEIRADGSLDFPDEVLAELDIVIASLHTSLSQSREQVTERVLNAIRNPHVDIIAHPTGRLMPDRPGADLDMDQILAAAAETGTILEINAHPRRLDLRDVHIRRAMDMGVLLTINTDAHHPRDFANRAYGVATAQRGWATADRIVNTWPVDRLVRYLQSRAA